MTSTAEAVPRILSTHDAASNRAASSLFEPEQQLKRDCVSGDLPSSRRKLIHNQNVYSGPIIIDLPKRITLSVLMSDLENRYNQTEAREASVWERNPSYSVHPARKLIDIDGLLRIDQSSVGTSGGEVIVKKNADIPSFYHIQQIAFEIWRDMHIKTHSYLQRIPLDLINNDLYRDWIYFEENNYQSKWYFYAMCAYTMLRDFRAGMDTIEKVMSTTQDKDALVDAYNQGHFLISHSVSSTNAVGFGMYPYFLWNRFKENFNRLGGTEGVEPDVDPLFKPDVLEKPVQVGSELTTMIPQWESYRQNVHRRKWRKVRKVRHTRPTLMTTDQTATFILLDQDVISQQPELTEIAA
jgi:hypothetical protein